jgi:hypothetical protein
MLIVLSALLSVGVASQASGPREWHLWAATMTGDVTVAKRETGKGKTDSGDAAPANTGKAKRPRLGPETYPSDRRAQSVLWRKLIEEAEESGALVVDLPSTISSCVLATNLVAGGTNVGRGRRRAPPSINWTSERGHTPARRTCRRRALQERCLLRRLVLRSQIAILNLEART